MAPGVRKLSDEIEKEWSQAITTGFKGLAWIVVSLLLFYFTGTLVKYEPLIVYLGYFLAIVALLAGLAMIGASARNAYYVRKRPTVEFTCPYCSEVNKLLRRPTEDFTCENCRREIHFIEGEPVAVRTIVCQACRAEHRVAVSIDRYMCDKCNRPLRIVDLDAASSDAPTVCRIDSSAIDPDAQGNQDVLLVAFDQRRLDELAFKVQDLLVVNAAETRRLMRLATRSAPLVIGMDVAPMKADAIRRELSELGASVQVRPTTAAARPAGRTV